MGCSYNMWKKSNQKVIGDIGSAKHGQENSEKVVSILTDILWNASRNDTWRLYIRFRFWIAFLITFWSPFLLLSSCFWYPHISITSPLDRFLLTFPLTVFWLVPYPALWDCFSFAPTPTPKSRKKSHPQRLAGLHLLILEETQRKFLGAQVLQDIGGYPLFECFAFWLASFGFLSGSPSCATTTIHA